MSIVARDPAHARFLAAQRIVTMAGPPWHTVSALPEGEILWRDGRPGNEDFAILTPDGWLCFVNGGGAALYERRVRATDEWVAELRGEATVVATSATTPGGASGAVREVDAPGSTSARARGCTCPEPSGETWFVDGACPLHGYGTPSPVR